MSVKCVKAIAEFSIEVILIQFNEYEKIPHLTTIIY